MKERERRPQPLATRRQRFGADLGHEPRVTCDRVVEQLLHLREIAREAGGSPNRLQRRTHRAVAVCRATIEPPKRRKPVLEPGLAEKRRKLLGRGKATDTRRKIRVRLAPRQRPAEKRHDAIEPEREEGLQAPRAAA